MLLDGFVIPHAHFKIFQGNSLINNTTKSIDQFPLVFNPLGAKNIAVDLHVREFVQLESQVKGLRHPQSATSAPHATSHLVNVAQSSSLAECLSFYSRLMTVESFAWPDFLTTIFTKLTEHFVTNDSELVRRVIVEVFQQSRAHLTQVNDATKIMSYVTGLIGQSKTARIDALTLLETMPTLIASDDANVHECLFSALTSDDECEQVLAATITMALEPQTLPSKLLSHAQRFQNKCARNSRLVDPSSVALGTRKTNSRDTEKPNSPEERYSDAMFAMLHGSMGEAHSLLSPVAAKIEHECFGNWIRALELMCEAENNIMSLQAVSMNNLHTLRQASMYMETAMTPTFGFELPRALLDTRAHWLELILRTQQFCGEITMTSTQGGERERRLAADFRVVADKFLQLRSKLLGATASDLDTIVLGIRFCNLLADAVDSLLLHSPLHCVPLDKVQPMFLSSDTSSLKHHINALESLKFELERKVTKLSAISSPRKASIGAHILMQLLHAVCSIPFAIPRLFFRSSMPKGRRIRSTLQFLTHAEKTTYATKPRPRSPIGVALGSDFVCSLVGAIVFDSLILVGMIHSVELQIRICDDMSNDLSTESIVTTNVSLNSQPQQSGKWLYQRVQAPIFIASRYLSVKKTCAIVVDAFVVDMNGEKWPLVGSGGHRGVIVY